MTAEGIHKILLLRFSSLGDILMTTAMVRAVRQRFPEARIDMVVRADCFPLIEHNPHLTHKIALPRRGGLRALRALGEQLRETQYDLVYDAHRSLRTRYLLPRLGARHQSVISKGYFRRSLALTFKVPRLTDRRRMLERFCVPLEPFGVRYDGGPPELRVDPTARARVEALLPPLGAGAQRVALIPSAQWPGKRWPLDRFRSVAERWVDSSPHHLLVLGGPEDSFCASLCAGLPPDRVTNLQGRLSLAESLAALTFCSFVVANDTGLMHAADALGIPSVLILGPTSAELGCLPYHPRAQILEHDLWCRPCSKNGQAPCLRGKRECLDRTTVNDVLGAMGRLLEAAP